MKYIPYKPMSDKPRVAGTDGIARRSTQSLQTMSVSCYSGYAHRNPHQMPLSLRITSGGSLTASRT